MVVQGVYLKVYNTTITPYETVQKQGEYCLAYNLVGALSQIIVDYIIYSPNTYNYENRSS